MWPRLCDLTPLGFVLYGGTAVALHLGHRQSVDFDFFTALPVDPILLPNRLPWLGSATTLQAEPNTLTVSAEVPGHSQGVKLSFSGGLSWATQDRALDTVGGVLKVASLPDLLATKLVVVQVRIEAKDYQDIAPMLRAGARLEDGLRRARQMHGAAFQPSETLKAMVFFEGGDLQTLSQADRETLIAAASSAGDL